MTYCNICKSPLDVPNRPWTNDCGGDCLACMAEVGDPDCAFVFRLQGECTSVLAQLRHLYAHLKNGTFRNATDLADGLLGPQIEKLETWMEAEE